MKKAISLILVLLLSCCFVSVSAYGFTHNGTATKKVTAYRLPSINSGDVWWMDTNDKVQVFCRDGDFYLVLYPFNNSGKHIIAYVPTSSVNTSGVPSSSDFYKNEIVRTNSNATLYHNPSTDTLTGASGSNQTVRNTVSKGQELTILFEKDGFYCVRTSNDTGFIEKSKICSHSNISRQTVSSGNATNTGDSSYHKTEKSYNEICNDCGLTTKSGISETLNEAHTFSGSRCSKCGYETAAEKCSHARTNDEIKGCVVSQKDDSYHTVTDTYDTNCADCKENIRKNVTRTYDEKHSLKNGLCEKCGYILPGSEASKCVHSNTAKQPSEAKASTAVSKDDSQHTVTSYYNVWCADCQSYIKENETEVVDENHSFANGVCSVCSFKKAAKSKTVNDGLYTIKNVSSGYMLNVYAGKDADGTKVTMWQNDNSTDQKIYIAHQGDGKYLLKFNASQSGRVIDVNRGSSITASIDVGDKIDIWPSNDPDAQLFYINDCGGGKYTFELVSKPGLLISPVDANAAKTNGSQLELRQAANADYQKWYIESTSAQAEAANFIWPVLGSERVTCVFQGYKGHNGMDIGGNPAGTSMQIVASKAGTVTKVVSSCPHDFAKSYNCGCSGGFGKYVKITHNDGTQTTYAHLRSIDVAYGQTVSQGQKIGMMGTTGWSSGVHLHFEIRINGSPVNPQNYVKYQ